MPTRTRMCAWIAGFGLALPSLTLAQDRTERDVVDLIVREGPHARAIRAAAEVTRSEQVARLSYPNPALLYSRESAGFTEFLQLEQTLPVFGNRAALSRAGVAATAAAEAERDARLWVLRAEALGAVARLGAAHARFEAVAAYVQETTRLIDVLRSREREGEGSRFDRLRAEQELRDARQLATSAAVVMAEAKSALSAMLPPGISLTRIVGPRPSPPPAGTLDSLGMRAASSRAELRALQRSSERAGLELDAARRAWLPVPTLFAGVKRADVESGRERGGIVGMSVSVPIFEHGRRDAARWAAERARVEAERASLEGQIRSEIRYADEALALRQAALTEDLDADADELTRIAHVAYREGEVGILELLDAVRSTSRARVRSIDVRLDVRLAQIALERAVGDVLWP